MSGKNNSVGLDQYSIKEGQKAKFVEPIMQRAYDAKILRVVEGGVEIIVYDWDEGRDDGPTYNTKLLVRLEDVQPDTIEVIKRIMRE